MAQRFQWFSAWWMMKNWLVVTGTMEFYDFPIILGISSSQLTTSIIFQWGRLKPPTSYNSARNPKFLKVSQFVGWLDSRLAMFKFWVDIQIYPDAMDQYLYSLYSLYSLYCLYSLYINHPYGFTGMSINPIPAMIWTEGMQGDPSPAMTTTRGEKHRDLCPTSGLCSG